MIITISGKPGSGKTKSGKMLAKKLGYKFYSIGDLRRRMALEKGISINHLNEIGEKEIWTDKDVDNYQKKLGKEEDNMIIEGRLSFHFIPESLRIFLEVSPEIGAKRIFMEKRKSEDEKENVYEVEKMLNKRIGSDKKRYLKYYRINCYDKNHYDITIDTTNLTINETVIKILNEIKNKDG